jgi:hypothetical protein
VRVWGCEPPRIGGYPKRKKQAEDERREAGRRKERRSTLSYLSKTEVRV